MKWKQSGNNVLIKVPKEQRLNTLGISVSDFIDPHKYVPCEGIVVSAPKRLMFYAGDFADWKGEYHAEMLQQSVQYDVPVEVKKGDVVIFQYTWILDSEYEVADGVFSVPYDALYARVDGDTLYPLNGLVLVAIEPPGFMVGGIQRKFAKEYVQKGFVMAEGCLVKKYHDGSDGDCGYPDLRGRTVWFPVHRAVRIEFDDIGRYLHGGYSLYKISRRHIVAYEGD